MLHHFGDVEYVPRNLPTKASRVSDPEPLQSNPEFPGLYLGRYQLLFPIASGGMATVYAARAVGEGGFQRLVALKLMLPHLARDERFVAMFMDEARVAGNIHSPYVVNALDLGRDGQETLFMAMDLIVGVPLSDLLADAESTGRSVPVPVALGIIHQAALGLEDAHNATATNGSHLRLVHRDISPQNILIADNGRVRISDFGVAHAVQRHAKTETGELKGKLAYFSPEQLDVEEVDQRSDVFSLGIVAWETLCGQRLFLGTNPLALAREVAEKPIPMASEVRSELPEEVAKIIADALERDPKKRIGTAVKFARAIENVGVDRALVAPASEIADFLHAISGRRVQQLKDKLKERLEAAEKGSLQNASQPDAISLFSSSHDSSSFGYQNTHRISTTRAVPAKNLKGKLLWAAFATGLICSMTIALAVYWTASLSPTAAPSSIETPASSAQTALVKQQKNSRIERQPASAKKASFHGETNLERNAAVDPIDETQTAEISSVEKNQPAKRPSTDAISLAASRKSAIHRSARNRAQRPLTTTSESTRTTSTSSAETTSSPASGRERPGLPMFDLRDFDNETRTPR